MRRLSLLILTLVIGLTLLGCKEASVLSQEEAASPMSIEVAPSDAEEEAAAVSGESLYQETYLLPKGASSADVYLLDDAMTPHFKTNVLYPSIIEESDVIALGRVLEQLDSSIGLNWPFPQTSFVIEFEDVFLGEPGQSAGICYDGGFITVDEYLQSRIEAEKEKERFTDLSESEKKQQLLGLFPAQYQPILPDRTYIFFLREAADRGDEDVQDSYFIIGAGHGVFSLDERGGKFVNPFSDGFTLEQLQLHFDSL